METKTIFLATLLILQGVYGMDDRCTLYNPGFYNSFGQGESFVEVGVEDRIVSEGDVFTLSIDSTLLIDGIGFDFWVGYDHTILELLDSWEGDYFSGCVYPTYFQADRQYSTVYSGACLGETVNASGSLWVYEFKALKAGESIIDVHCSRPTYLTFQGDTSNIREANINVAQVRERDGVITVKPLYDYSTLTLIGENYGKETVDGDLNGDGIVDYDDLVILAGAYRL